MKDIVSKILETKDITIISTKEEIGNILFSIPLGEADIIINEPTDNEYLILNRLEGKFGANIYTITKAVEDYELDWGSISTECLCIDSRFIKDFTYCCGELNLKDVSKEMNIF